MSPFQPVTDLFPFFLPDIGRSVCFEYLGFEKSLTPGKQKKNAPFVNGWTGTHTTRVRNFSIYLLKTA